MKSFPLSLGFRRSEKEVNKENSGEGTFKSKKDRKGARSQWEEI